MPSSSVERQIGPGERELAARCAVLAARMYEMHGWEFATSEPDRDLYVPGAEKLAETITYLLRVGGGGATGRMLVIDTDLGTEVYLHLGTLTETGAVEVDDAFGVTRG